MGAVFVGGARLTWAWPGVAAALIAGLVLAAFMSSPATAQTKLQAPVPDKPFAEHHLVIQLSDREPAKQALALSVPYNLLKFYDPDKISIVVVAFGSGIDLLRANSPNRTRVDSLISQGVEFDVCMNTVDTIERETGKKVDLNPKAVKVQVGVGRILELAEKGYTLVRP
jgi:intracellular sulfur oxidation DsrE/DsrF family protein